jgi:hypothetical protein
MEMTRKPRTSKTLEKIMQQGPPGCKRQEQVGDTNPQQRALVMTALL